MAKDFGGGQELSDFIEVKVVSLQHLFSAYKQYFLPWEQRAYAWQDEHAVRLVTDLLNAFAENKSHYFLGYISVSAKPGETRAAVIDGQQRLVTLTMLFALLRDRLSDNQVRAALDRCIWAAGTPAPDPVLLLQDHVRGYFEASMATGATRKLERFQSDDLAECEYNIANNLVAVAGVLAEHVNEPERLAAFTNFLLTRCRAILQIVADREEAWQILATEEETGLGFHASERSKVTLVSAMPIEQQAAAGQLWLYWQNRIGAERMHRLLNYLRIMALGPKWRGRGNSPVEMDLLKSFDISRQGFAFIERELGFHAHSLARIADRDFQDAADPDAVAHYLYFLEWLPFDTWMPPILAWIQSRGLGHPETIRFLERLDRLGWLMLVSGLDPNKRERIFAAAMEELRHDRPVDSMRFLQIPDDVRLAALANLRSRTFYHKRFNTLVMRRLCFLLGNDPGLPDGFSVTCEHVLPRNPPPESEWRVLFDPRGGAKQYSDRLGNVVFLSFGANQSAGTADWGVKRKLLQASQFALSQHAARFAAWTPETVEQRTEELITILFDLWRLPIEPTQLE